MSKPLFILIFLFSFCQLFAGDALETKNFTGPVTLQRAADGSVLSATITSKKGESITIKPCKATVSVNDAKKNFKIDAKDMARFAGLEGKTVHAFLACLNGRPVDIKSLVVLTSGVGGKM